MIRYALCATLLLASCGGDDDTNDAGCPSQTTVSIDDVAFSPTCITVQHGQTVTWTNHDTTSHLVETDANQPETFSGTIINTNGGTYQHAFNTAGTINLHCGFHSSMTMKVVVE